MLLTFARMQLTVKELQWLSIITHIDNMTYPVHLSCYVERVNFCTSYLCKHFCVSCFGIPLILRMYLEQSSDDKAQIFSNFCEARSMF